MEIAAKSSSIHNHNMFQGVRNLDLNHKDYLFFKDRNHSLLKVVDHFINAIKYDILSLIISYVCFHYAIFDTRTPKLIKIIKVLTESYVFWFYDPEDNDNS